MNREALPLIFGISIPIALVSLIIIHFKFYNLSEIALFFKEINLVYYIIICPIALGLLVAILKYGKE